MFNAGVMPVERKEQNETNNMQSPTGFVQCVSEMHTETNTSCDERILKPSSSHVNSDCNPSQSPMKENVDSAVRGMDLLIQQVERMDRNNWKNPGKRVKRLAITQVWIVLMKFLAQCLY